MTIKRRRVGDIDIYVTDDGRLIVDDLRRGEHVDLTDEYYGTPVDEYVMADVERRVRSGDLFRQQQRLGGLLAFLKS